MKKVSIVLPVYNGAERVAGAIESILAQTYDNIELIIVDDCSTDNTSEIINKYAQQHSNIKVIRNEKNRKLPASLNVGFEEASGDYLSWTSDDNRYYTTAIEKMVEALEANSEYDFVYAGFVKKYADGSEERVIPLPPKELYRLNVVGACFLYSKQLAEKIGKYDINLFLAEDYDYWIRAYKNGKLLCLPEVLYEYCLHDKSLTSTRKNELSYMTFCVLEKHFYYFYTTSGSLKGRVKLLYNMLNRLDKNKRQEALANIEHMSFFEYLGINLMYIKARYEKQ